MHESNHHTRKEIEELERWLAGFDTPSPSPQAVRCTKSAARRELLAHRVGGTAGRWKAWHGSIAAAAAILLAVGVGWYSQSMDAPAGWASADRDVLWTLPERSQEGAIRLALLDEDLTEVEAWISEMEWGVSGASAYEFLEAALAEPDDEPQSRGPRAIRNTQSI